MIALVVLYLLCVLAMVKIWHFRAKFDQHLSLYCGSENRSSRQSLDIDSCESLVSYDFQNLPTILAQFLQSTLKNSSNFLTHWNNVEKNGAFTLFETSVNGDVTFHTL